MNDDEKSAPSKSPPYWTTAGEPPRRRASLPQSETPLTRFLGGPPGSVFLRLVFVSLIVGAFLMWLDIRPVDVFRAITDLINRIWGLGFDAIREVANYILAGAVLVIPVWLILRLMNMRDGR